MKLAIKAELVYTFAQETQIIANIEASQSNDQAIISESLESSLRSNCGPTRRRVGTAASAPRSRAK